MTIFNTSKYRTKDLRRILKLAAERELSETKQGSIIVHITHGKTPDPLGYAIIGGDRMAIFLPRPDLDTEPEALALAASHEMAHLRGATETMLDPLPRYQWPDFRMYHAWAHDLPLRRRLIWIMHHDSEAEDMARRMGLKDIEVAAVKAEVEPDDQTRAVVRAAGEIIKASDRDRFEIAISMLDVRDDHSFRRANDLLVELVKLKDEWDKYWKPKTSSAWATFKILKDAYNGPAAFIDSMIDKVKSAMAAYSEQKKRIVQAQQQALVESTEALKEAQLKEARSLIRKGMVVEGQILRQQATDLQAPIISDTTPKLDGTRVREEWGDFEVTDFQALVKAVAEGMVPLDALVSNDTVIRNKIKQMRKSFDWPGIVAKPRINFAVERR
jgi:hypothetical protein